MFGIHNSRRSAYLRYEKSRLIPFHTATSAPGTEALGSSLVTPICLKIQRYRMLSTSQKPSPALIIIRGTRA